MNLHSQIILLLLIALFTSTTAFGSTIKVDLTGNVTSFAGKIVTVAERSELGLGPTIINVGDTILYSFTFEETPSSSAPGSIANYLTATTLFNGSVGNYDFSGTSGSIGITNDARGRRSVSDSIGISVSESDFGFTDGNIGLNQVDNSITTGHSEANLPLTSITVGVNSDGTLIDSLDLTESTFNLAFANLSLAAFQMNFSNTSITIAGTLSSVNITNLTGGPVPVAIGINPIDDQFIEELQELTFTAIATDNDSTSTSQAFSLDTATIDRGASIDAATGIFSWTPSADQGPAIYTVVITVTNDGSTPSSDSEEFKITVNDPSAVMLELDKGWNLISLPKQPQDNTIGNIFENRTVGAVWTWDKANKSFIIAQEITPDKGTSTHLALPPQRPSISHLNARRAGTSSHVEQPPQRTSSSHLNARRRAATTNVDAPPQRTWSRHLHVSRAATSTHVEQPPQRTSTRRHNERRRAATTNVDAPPQRTWSRHLHVSRAATSTDVEQPPQRTSSSHLNARRGAASTNVDAPRQRTSTRHVNARGADTSTHVGQPPQRTSGSHLNARRAAASTHVEQPPERTSSSHLNARRAATSTHVEQPPQRTSSSHINTRRRATQTHVNSPPQRTSTRHLNAHRRATSTHVAQPPHRTSSSHLNAR